MARKYDLHLKGYVGGWDFDANYVDYVIKDSTKTEISVLISSTGGSVNTALNVSDAFRRHGNVTVHFVGMNASAATIASLGAKKITIDADALYLVHKASLTVDVWKSLNSDKTQELIESLQKNINTLNKIDLILASAYARRCKKTVAELSQLMAEEKWITAHEAKEWGFVDEVTNYEDDEKTTASALMAEALQNAGLPIPEVWGEQSKPKRRTAFRAFFDTLFNTTDDNMDNKKNDEKTSLEDRIKELEAKIEALVDSKSEGSEDNSKEAKASETEDSTAKKPGDVDKKVVDNSTANKEASINEFCNSLSEAKKLFNSLP